MLKNKWTWIVIACLAGFVGISAALQPAEPNPQSMDDKCLKLQAQGFLTNTPAAKLPGWDPFCSQYGKAYYEAVFMILNQLTPEERKSISDEEFSERAIAEAKKHLDYIER